MLLVIAVMVSGCMVFGIRTSEQPQYRVLLTDGNKEIREYPPLVLARTLMEGAYGETSDDSFRRLAGYIFGRNRGKTDKGNDPMKIAMTAPVLQEPGNGVWQMSFVMPSEYDLEDLPEPEDERIVLEEVPGFKVASLRYTGLTSETKIAKKTEELRAWLKERGIKVVGKSLSARYDPPWTIPFLRRNEVMLLIEHHRGDP